nr:unnamed protein product [Callosobruchus analis]
MVGDASEECGDSDTKIQMLNSFVQIVNVKQFNNVYNKNNRILDLVFHNSDCVVSKSLNSFVKEDSHHPALDIHCKLEIAVNHKDNFPLGPQKAALTLTKAYKIKLFRSKSN